MRSVREILINLSGRERNKCLHIEVVSHNPSKDTLVVENQHMLEIEYKCSLQDFVPCKRSKLILLVVMKCLKNLMMLVAGESKNVKGQ